MENTSISPDAFLNTPSPAVNYFTPLQSPPSGTYLGKEGSERPLLFTPLKIRDVVFQNRIWVSPMSQYSADDGRLTDWHLVQLGSYASRGASLIMTEATSVTPDGRCTLEDAGLWKDDQIESFKRVTDFIHSQGQKAGLQLQHAGRKASTTVPWIGFHGAFGENGWPETVFGPSSVAFNSSYCTPKSMTKPQIREVIAAFADSARRAVKAGYDLIELHGAHGKSL
jgi:2,4-dienoyl-CoA reductase-like NADH-dependent reductase (Old Yellow Enzyme family)